MSFNMREQRSFVDQPLRTISGTDFFRLDLALDAIVLQRAFRRHLATILSEKFASLTDGQRESEVVGERRNGRRFSVAGGAGVADCGGCGRSVERCRIVVRRQRR